MESQTTIRTVQAIEDEQRRREQTGAIVRTPSTRPGNLGSTDEELRAKLAQLRAQVAEARNQCVGKRPEYAEEWEFRSTAFSTVPPRKHRELVSMLTIDNFHDPDMVLGIANRLRRGGLVHLTGGRGTGKTQLAAWLWSACKRRHAVYTTAADMLSGIKSWYSIDAKDAAHNNRTLQTVPLLIIDEMHERRGTDEDEHLLVALLDKRYGNMVGTLLVSNLEEKTAEANFGRSVTSRLKEFGDHFVTRDWPNYREMNREVQG